MKIPTILGLFILLLIAFGVAFTTVSVKQDSPKPSEKIIPVSIERNNLGSRSVTITWQTTTHTTTELLISTNADLQPVLQDLKDNRDSDTPQPRLTHIVTINDLSPSTNYYFKIKIASNLYPEQGNLIKTLATSPEIFANYNPVIGSMVDNELQPVTDALIFLLIQDTYPLSASVGKDGNFILPLTLLGNRQDPNLPVDPQSLSNAILVIKRGELQSEVEISITPESKPLPPIVLGQNLDLRQR